MLSSAQRTRLQMLHAYEWVDDDPAVMQTNLDNIFKDIETAEELWYASFIIPWDLTDHSLLRILDHPLCDRGIALFLYWTLDPVSHHRRVLDPPPNETLFKLVESRLVTQFYSSQVIAFSPSGSHNYDDDNRGVPPLLLAPTTGIKVDLDYREAVFHEE